MNFNDYVKFCPICNETKQNTSLCFNNEKFREFTKGYFYLFEPKDNSIICPCCERGKLENSPLTFEEFKVIDEASNSDRQFLETMIKLKQDDIIEYQSRMNQFRIQIQQQTKQVEKENSIPKCPHCHSTNIKSISGLNRGASIAILGIFSKKINKSFECKNCGYTW